MVKQWFGVTSSPSVANFCLRKIAQLHQEEFDKEVIIETVNRDMYVDDMMKSTIKHQREGNQFSRSTAEVARERWIPLDEIE